MAVRDFDTISIEDVVEETEITVGSIYFHFKSKDGLMTAIAEEDIEQFFAYFDNIGDEDLFSSAFLLAWRSVQQYINRRGHTQLLQWYFNINPDSVSASWLPRQSKLVKGFAKLIAANNGREAPDEDDIILAELLFNGMDGLLISQSRLMTSDKLIRGEKPLDLAIRLARSWYRAAGGPDAGKLTPEQRRSVKRIVNSTEMLQRPVRLPPV
ncbi:TetR/AcrR family transcriptional regulator [Algimonas porphyrae]|uniref:TetR/AcrR family transcriptional regulator n=1 Tax=Algimonas porphyrae TaxID=1128113 RepID=UPI0024E12E09|nr:TetR/AcrR family transcriptional regulator [Algimonas porphyrae]